jgi:hypothetical protein
MSDFRIFSGELRCEATTSSDNRSEVANVLNSDVAKRAKRKIDGASSDAIVRQTRSKGPPSSDLKGHDVQTARKRQSGRFKQFDSVVPNLGSTCYAGSALQVAQSVSCWSTVSWS